MFMGGEYLPDYMPGETEIARFDLQSTTSDVISIRARRRKKGIHYRVVDEYETDFNMPQQTSQKPFSLTKVIELIDKTDEGEGYGGLALGYNNCNAHEMSRHELQHFTTISSDIYRQLQIHYEHVYEDWVADE